MPDPERPDKGLPRQKGLDDPCETPSAHVGPPEHGYGSSAAQGHAMARLGDAIMDAKAASDAQALAASNDAWRLQAERIDALYCEFRALAESVEAAGWAMEKLDERLDALENAAGAGPRLPVPQSRARRGLTP